MSFAKSTIKTLLVLSLFASMGITLLVHTQTALPVNATENPDAAAAQTVINTNSWNALKLIGPLLVILIFVVIMKYMDLI